MTETRGATAAPERGRREGSDRGPGGRLSQSFRNLALFYRQVVAELRKVVWPTRKELITYTSVVMVFVLVVIAFVSILDFGFGQLTIWIFG